MSASASLAPSGKAHARSPRRSNAMSAEDKHQRRAELLVTARSLFRSDGILPTVSDIASATGLAKGTVYLYFRSKEELFVALLEHDFDQLMRDLHVIIAQLPAERELAPAAMAEAYASTLETLPDLLPLAGLAHGVLEKNLPLTALQEFKGGLARALQQAGAALSHRYPGFSTEAGNRLLLNSWALTLGLSQSLRIPDELAQAMQGPEFAVFRRDPGDELRIALAALWRGSL